MLYTYHINIPIAFITSKVSILVVIFYVMFQLVMAIYKEKR